LIFKPGLLLRVKSSWAAVLDPNQFTRDLTRYHPAACPQAPLQSLRPSTAHTNHQKAVRILCPSAATASKGGPCTAAENSKRPQHRGPKGGEIGPRCNSCACSPPAPLQSEPGVKNIDRVPDTAHTAKQRRNCPQASAPCLRLIKPSITNPPANSRLARANFTALRPTTSRAAEESAEIPACLSADTSSEIMSATNPCRGEHRASCADQPALVCGTGKAWPEYAKKPKPDDATASRSRSMHE